MKDASEPIHPRQMSIQMIQARSPCNRSKCGCHWHSYDSENDTCGVFFLLGSSFLSAYYVHPSLNSMKSPDVAWTAGLYMEALAMVPQLWMLAKKGGEIDGLASHYIACVFFSRVFTLCFWLNSYVELAPHGSEYNIPGWGVLGAQLLQA